MAGLRVAVTVVAVAASTARVRDLMDSIVVKVAVNWTELLCEDGLML